MRSDEIIRKCIEKARNPQDNIEPIIAYGQFNSFEGGHRIHAFMLEIDDSEKQISKNVADSISKMGITINSTFEAQIHGHSHTGTRVAPDDFDFRMLHNIVARPQNQSHIYRDEVEEPPYTFLFLTNSDLVSLQRRLGFGKDGH